MNLIYFMLIDNAGISIGQTTNLRRRMQQHARTKHDVHDVKLLVAVQGSPACEKHIQRYFVNDAMPGFEVASGTPEFFRPSQRLTNYIRWLRNQWFAIIDESDEPEGSVSFDSWEPSPERETPPPQHPLFAPDCLEFNERLVTGDDYYTNTNVLERARRVLGEIDLDPASHPMANKFVKARKFFTIQEDGVSQKWSGRVWLNPPFSEWKRWVPKILSELRGSRVQAMLLYSAMRTITAQYYRPLLDEADAMCVITGRLRHGGKGTDSPDDGHVVFAYRCDKRRFASEFGEIGVVWVKPIRPINPGNELESCFTEKR